VDRPINAAELTAVDTETTSLEPMTAQLVGISLSVKAGEACYIPVAHAYQGVPQQLEREQVLAAEAVAGRRHQAEGRPEPQVRQPYLRQPRRVAARHHHDTLLESYVFESHRTHDMDSLALRHLNHTTIPFADVCGKGASRLPSTRWRSAAPPSTRRKTPTSRCACTSA
jgi:DNA polymerase-1